MNRSDPLINILLFFLFFNFMKLNLFALDLYQFKSGVTLGVAEEYDAAITVFSDLSHQFPNDPAPHFFAATIWQTRGMDFETRTWQNLFYAELNHTVALCDSLLALQPQNAYCRFFMGSALAYKSFQLSREKNYLSALNYARKGIHQLKLAIKLDNTFYDAYLGLGSYLYWRSYMTRVFSWLPFFSDQRDKGIEMISLAMEKGKLSRWAAISNLAWIFIQEKQFDKAISYAQLGLEDFPNARSFLWPLGDAQFLNGNYEAAAETYNRLLQSVTEQSFNNHYNEIVLHLKLAQCHIHLGQAAEAERHAKKVLSITPAIEVKERVRKKRKEAEQLLKRLNATH